MFLRRTSLRAVLYCIAGVSVFLGCNENGVGPNNDPALSNLTGIKSLLYVAYPSPDEYTKLDTMKISFNYNAAKISSIIIEVTLDGGSTWRTIASKSPAAGNAMTVNWVPKDADSAIKNFFGFKTGRIRVLAPPTSESLESDSFTLIGAMPLILYKPLGGETFGMNDSVIVEYSANMDLLSNILAFFKTDAMDNWEEFIDAEKLPSPQSPIEHWKKWFIPSQLDAWILAKAGNFADPIRIHLQDYSNDLAVQTSGYITIRP